MWISCYGLMSGTSDYTGSEHAPAAARGLAQRTASLRQGDATDYRKALESRGASTGRATPKSRVPRWLMGNIERLPPDFTRKNSQRARSRSGCSIHKEISSAAPRRTNCAAQGARCMDCGIPFCQHGCPLGNRIPGMERPGLSRSLARGARPVARDEQFPEFTGRALSGAVRGRLRARNQRTAGDDQGDREGRSSIAAFDEGWVVANRHGTAHRQACRDHRLRTGGLAAAEQLNRAGHQVTVFERADRIGGLLRYGIPEFKMEKRCARTAARADGCRRRDFRTGANVGVNVAVEDLRRSSMRSLLAGGANATARFAGARPGAQGIHFAMDFLTLQNRRNEGDTISDDEFITPGQARRHHRRRRHGRGLSRHGASSGRPLRASVRAAVPAAERARDPTIPGPNGRTFTVCPVRTRRAAIASSRYRPSGSPAMRAGG